MARPPGIARQASDRILTEWAAGATAKEIARGLGCPPKGVHQVVCLARRAGDPRAVARKAEGRWRPEPISYPSSRAYLDAALARAREAQARWDASEMGIRMREIAVPPDDRESPSRVSKS
jgi:hypothetical protein